MKKVIIFFFLLSLFLRLSAQEIDLKNYTYLKSSGEIPDVFRTLSVEKFNEDKSKLESDRRMTRKAKEQFLLSSNYYINQLLLSGRVLFNDPVSEYIGKVADNLLKSNPDLRDQLTFYAIKSPYVNAFSSDKGIVFVNLGLIAQLENEAQLAYVISHEIIHFTKKHNINLFLENKRIYGKHGDNHWYSLDEKYLAESYRSKEAESESDKLGYTDIFAKSDYSPSEIEGAFDMLQYSYLPFDDVVFDKSLFETDYLKIPASRFLKTVNPIKANENFDDSKSSHPNIRKRKDMMKLLTDSASSKNKKAFILPKAEFEKIRNIARFEVIRQELIEREYVDAIYNSAYMMKEFPDNHFLQTSVAGALYCMTQYKLNGKISRVLPDYEKMEGQSQQLCYLFENMTKQEMNVIALRYAYKVKAKFPTDDYINDICKDLFASMVNECKLSLADFSAKSKEATVAVIQQNVVVSDTVNLSKYDKIKKQKLVNDTTDEGFIRYAFVDLLKDYAFVEEFNKLMTAKDEKVKENFGSNFNDKDKAAEKKRLHNEKLDQRNGKALGINKIVIIDPFYIKLDQRKAEEMKYIGSEKSLLTYNDKLVKNAAISGLDMNLVNSQKLEKSEVEKFNDMALMKDWLNERSNNDDIELIPCETKNILILAEKYGTSYFAWSGVITAHLQKDNIGYMICLSFIPYFLPYTLYNLLHPSYSTYYVFLLYDSNTGKLKLDEVTRVRNNDRNDFLNSQIYDTFNQIRKKRK
jgi:hypothetical protein